MSKAVFVRFCGVTGVLAAMWLTAGCASSGSSTHFECGPSDATVFVDPQSAAIRKVAILPFKAPTELIGASLSDLFVTEILRTRRYTLVERGQIAKVLSESELSLSGMTSSKAVEIGSMVGADGVVIGTVDQYETRAYKGHTYPAVGVTVRLIDCKTSRVAWSADLASQAESKRDTLATHSRAIVRDIISGLYSEWIKYRAPELPARFDVQDCGLRETVLSWTAPKERDAVYEIERAVTPEGPFSPVGSVEAAEEHFIDTGLSDGKTYYYRVTALGDNGVRAGPSGVYESFTAPPPAEVSGLNVEGSRVGTIHVRWQPSREATVERYLLERSEGGDRFAPLATLDGRQNTEYFDGGKEPGSLPSDARYVYRVTAVNSVGARSPACAPVAGRTHPPPPQVEMVEAVSGEPRKVTVKWAVSQDVKVETYEILRNGPEGEGFQRVGSVKGREVNTFVDMGERSLLGGLFRSNKGTGALADETTYRYAVVAVNLGEVRSVQSAAVNAVTKAVPVAPARIAATDDQYGKVIITCEVPSAADIARLHVERAVVGDGDFKQVAKVEYAGDGEARIEDSKAPANLPLRYRLAFEDGDGLLSAWSDPVGGACLEVVK